MRDPNQIDMRIIETALGIIGVFVMATDVLCIFVILCIQIFASQVKAMTGPSHQIT